MFKVVNDPNASLTGGSYKLAVAGHDTARSPTTRSRRSSGAWAAPADDRRRGHRHRPGHRGRPAGWRAPSPTRPTSTRRPGSPRSGRSPRSPWRRPPAASCAARPAAHRPHVPADQVPRAPEGPGPVSATATCRRRSSRPTPGRSGTRSRSARRSTSLDAISLIETYKGRTPHVTNVNASIKMRRGEQLASCAASRRRSACAPASVTRLRVKMQRVRGGNLTRTYRVRIPSLKPGQRTLKLVGFEQSRGRRPARAAARRSSLDGEGPSHGPTNLTDLIESIGRSGAGTAGR